MRLTGGGELLSETLELLKARGIDLGSDVGLNNLVGRLETALRAIKSHRAKLAREEAAADAERQAAQEKSARRDAMSSSKHVNANAHRPQGSCIAMAQDVPHHGQRELVVSREAFASGKVPETLYKHSDDEAYLLSQWVLFDTGHRSSPPDKPRPAAKPRLVIKDG